MRGSKAEPAKLLFPHMLFNAQDFQPAQRLAAVRSSTPTISTHRSLRSVAADHADFQAGRLAQRPAISPRIAYTTYRPSSGREDKVTCSTSFISGASFSSAGGVGFVSVDTSRTLTPARAQQSRSVATAAADTTIISSSRGGAAPFAGSFRTAPEDRVVVTSSVLGGSKESEAWVRALRNEEIQFKNRKPPARRRGAAAATAAAGGAAH